MGRRAVPGGFRGSHDGCFGARRVRAPLSILAISPAPYGPIQNGAPTRRAPRAGLVIYGTLDTVSGGYLYDRELVRALQRRGWDVSVFSLPWRSYPAHLTDNWRKSFARSVEQAPLDVLIQDELNHPSLVLVNRRLRTRLSCPIVSVVHHLRSSESRARWQNVLYAVVERAYLRGVDAFICNSRRTSESVRKLSGREQPYVIAYPAGDRFDARVDEAQVRKRAHADTPLRIVFLGNVIPRKGLETLVRAVAALRAGTWSLTVVGDLRLDPKLVSRVREQISTGDLAGNIELAGRLPDARVAEILCQSHVLAVPSSFEGFGIAYLEGMSFGLPAIATGLGGAAEIIDDGVNGYLVAPGDAVAIQQRLHRLSWDRALLEQMGVSALQRARSHPCWAQSMSTAVRFLESLGAPRFPAARHA